MATKKKRKLNGLFLALVAFILLIVISIFKIPSYITDTNLNKLGYSEEAIEIIRKNKLDKKIIENNYYSDYLNKEIVKENFEVKYLRLYLVMNEINEDDKYLYNRLAALKGYNEDELVKLFGSLEYYNLTPLVVFDKVDIDSYVADCLKNNNSESSFNVSGNYFTKYTNVINNTNPSDYEVYLSYSSCIKDYDSSKIKLVTINSMNAIDGIKLESKAADAFNDLCSGIRQAGIDGVYAVKGYVSYESLKKEYDSYGGGNISDQRFMRPEYDEKQLGYSVEVTTRKVVSGDVKFEESDQYKWLVEHAHEYGFIIRYPENKEDITMSNVNYRYLRYVGTDLATKIYESGLTFDEYYYLFILAID